MRTPTPWSRLWLLVGAIAVALFTAASLLLSDTPSTAMVRFVIGLASLILAALLVNAVLAELGRRRLEAQLLVLTTSAASAAQLQEVTVMVSTLATDAHNRFAQMSRDLRVDRMYFRDVLQEIARGMDDLSRLERAQFEVLRDMNDSGPNRALKL